MVAHLAELRQRKEELEQMERSLDEQQHKMEQCLRNISEDTTSTQYPLLGDRKYPLFAIISQPFLSVGL